MLKLLEKKQHIFFIFAGLFCFFTAFVLLHSFQGKFGQASVPSVLPAIEDTIEVGAAIEPSGAAAKQAAPLSSVDPASSKLVVYITGSVKKPGVYELQENTRAYQALEAAGGFATDADREGVNLAVRLSDGMHIRFPSINENCQVPRNSDSKPSALLPVAPSRASVAGELVNLNTCTAVDLGNLPGIGPKTVQMILRYREENGYFRRTEDLLLIKGIGSKKFDAIRSLVTVES